MTSKVPENSFPYNLTHATTGSIFGGNYCHVMDESKDNKIKTYWDVTLMLCYFWIPFFGLKAALKKYTETDDLPFMAILLLLFISGNIVTWMILWLNDKSLLAKTLWTVGLLFTMIVLNFLVK